MGIKIDTSRIESMTLSRREAAVRDQRQMAATSRSRQHRDAAAQVNQIERPLPKTAGGPSQPKEAGEDTVRDRQVQIGT